jgi:hypothetical protein
VKLRPLAAILLGTIPASAEAPKLEALFPAGGQAGSSFVLTASGRVEADARLWTSVPGVHFVPNGKKREWQVTLAADAPRGLHLVHCANADGASEPRWFSIGSLPESTEAEPNDEVARPQSVEKLPATINARLDKSGDVDGYAVKLDAGQTLVAAVEAYSIGSGTDMLANLMDEKGTRLHTASDSRNLDPLLVFKAPKSGRYIVQLAGFAHPPAADVRFTGGSTLVYRLHLSAGPVVTQIHPAAVASAGRTEAELTGHNLDPKKTRLTLEAKEMRREGDLGFVMPPGALQPLQVVVTARPAAVEKEPNNKRDQATALQAGGAVGGRITDKADVDRFAIPMKKGEKLQARLFAKRIGMPLDALLKVEAPDGRLLTSADDESEQRPDPVVTWTAAVDGPHHLVVEDLFHQGGADKAYVIEVSAPSPGFEVTLADAKPVVIEAGKSVSLKATVKLLNGFKEPLVARVANLPPGVAAPDVAVPEKGGEVEIKLQAATNAPRGGQPVQVEIWSRNAPFASRPAIAPLRGENKRGTSPLDDTPQVWLTVK